MVRCPEWLMFVGFDNDSFRALLGVFLLGPQGGPFAVPFKFSDGSWFFVMLEPTL